MKGFTRYKLHHVLFWMAYFVFWCSLSVYQYHTPFRWALLVTATWFAGQAGLIYTAVYLLLPRFFAARRYARWALSLAALLVASSAFIAVLSGMVFQHVMPGHGLPLYLYFFYVLLNNFFVAGLVMAIRLTSERIKAGRHQRQVEKERAENELRFLKSQVNPHFLFNAINSIYVLIKKDPDTAAATLAQFADMLRYQLYECNVDEIPIEKERAYLENYINLEKLRKGDSVVTLFSVNNEVQHFAIAPLLIIPFVENAFKHVGRGKAGKASISIEMNYDDNMFRLHVENTIDSEQPQPAEKGYGGIGLENVRRRLALIYPARHSMQVNTGNGVYSVILHIKIAG